VFPYAACEVVVRGGNSYTVSEILDFYGSDDVDCGRLGCEAVYPEGGGDTFFRNRLRNPEDNTLHYAKR
jgi:hypothetical protein